jgi:Uma2 family endonuclease
MSIDTEWTAERVYALPEDGKRYEVLDGELVVTPAPSWGHQDVVAVLLSRLNDYVRAHGIGHARPSPADIEFSSRRLVQPDLFVVPPTADGKRAASWSEIRKLLLAVEVLSPTTARHDRGKKRAIYQSEGVAEYWIVDVDARCVERWRPDDERPEVVHGSLAWQPDPALAPLILDLEAMFEEAVK